VIHTQHHGQLAQITDRQNCLVRWSARMTDRYACVSEDSAAQAHGNRVPHRKLAIIHNSIDIERFSYAGPVADGPAVTVARLHPLKGIDVLLRASAHIVQTEPSFRLEIAGDGPHRAELEKLVDELDLQKHIRFLGETRDIAGLLSRSRLFVLPSFSEGISLTLLEAMAVGLPVVATRVGGNPEVVVPDETGLLVPARDVEELRRAMLQLWRDAGQARRFGAAGRRRVEERFDVRQMVRKYEGLYAGLAEQVWSPPAAAVSERETQATAVCS
jgi:glycosyltransferase involved in cell wall biosynthesis